MVKLDADNDQPYHFGVKHVQHRIFNETPAIHRQMIKLAEESNATTRMLKQREPFTERTAVPKMSKPLMVRSMAAHNETAVTEGFCSKPIKAIRNFIDSILSVAVIVAFLVFMAYLYWVCFIDDWRGERVTDVNRMEY
jgi:hypothetical protein